MKKTAKILLILFLIGICGTAVMLGYIMGSGQLMSHEAEKDYAVKETFSALQLNTVAAQVTAVPSESMHVEAYAKAWLPGPVNMDDVVNVRVQDGVLVVTETPFPAEFFGVFPQPYEMKLTIYMPQELYDTYTEDLGQ